MKEQKSEEKKKRATDVERRDARIDIVLTRTEKTAIIEKASLSGLSLCRYMVSASLALPVTPKADQKVIAAINKVGVNVNQLVRNINTNKGYEHEQILLAKLEVILSELTAIKHNIK